MAAQQSVKDLLELITASATALAPIAVPLDQPLTPDQLRPPPPGAVPDVALDALATFEAAMAQLKDLILPAGLTVAKTAMAFHSSAALRIAMHAHVAEILRDQPQGLHVKDIAAKTGIAPGVLLRSLRLLACRSIFREVLPGVFAANKLSSPLDTGLTVDELLEPVTPEVCAKSSPFASLTSHTVDEVFPAAAVTLKSLVAAPLDEYPGAKACEATLGRSDFFDAIKADGNGWRVARFTAAMRVTSMLMPSPGIVAAYPFAELAAGPIIDVGGADGAMVALLHAALPDRKFAVHDLPEVIDGAKTRWQAQDPKALEDGSVTLHGQSFYDPQPEGLKPAAYLLKLILHDHNDERCTTILKHLRKAATPETKLLIADVRPIAVDGADVAKQIVTPICGVEGEPGTGLSPVLLANGGESRAVVQLVDMQMLAVLSGRERTLDDFKALFAGAGWRFTRVFELQRQNAFKLLEAVPA